MQPKQPRLKAKLRLNSSMYLLFFSSLTSTSFSVLFFSSLTLTSFSVLFFSSLNVLFLQRYECWKMTARLTHKLETFAEHTSHEDFMGILAQTVKNCCTKQTQRPWPQRGEDGGGWGTYMSGMSKTALRWTVDGRQRQSGSPERNVEATS